MPFDVIEAMKAELTPDVLQHLGAHAGTDGPTTERAVGAAAPALLGGLVSQGSTEAGAGKLLAMAGNLAGGSPYTSASALLGSTSHEALAQQGSGMLGFLFAGRHEVAAGSIGHQAGIGPLAATRLLGLLAPMAVGMIGREASRAGLGASGLASLLGGQREIVAQAVPAGLMGLVDSLGLGARTPEVEVLPPEREPRRAAREAAYLERGRARAMGPTQPRRSSMTTVMLAVLAFLAVWSLMRGRHRPTSLESQGRAPSAALRAPRAGGPITLPNGTALNASPGSGTYELATTLARGGHTDQRFGIEGLMFDSGSAKLSPSSQAAVQSLANTLAAYPSARVRIVGHTDPRGDPLMNQQLSQSRADAVKSALQADGVSGDRLEAVGVASEQPANAESRRTEVQLLAP